MTARSFIIGHRAPSKDGERISFLTPFVEIGWYPCEAHARRFHTEAEARGVLALMEPSRTGSRFIAEEIRLPDGTLAHREIAL